jgi:hypothetical protein
MNDALSLTPALSRWEREKRSLRLGKTCAVSGSKNFRRAEWRQLLFPSSSGRGIKCEGERLAFWCAQFYFVARKYLC